MTSYLCICILWRIESCVPIQARSSTRVCNKHLAIEDGSKERWCRIGIRRQQRRSRRRVHAIVRCSQQANEGRARNSLGHMVGTHHHALALLLLLGMRLSLAREFLRYPKFLFSSPLVAYLNQCFGSSNLVQMLRFQLCKCFKKLCNKL